MAPLLFETSLQAQFLIPMATSIAFGLAVTSFLVLLLVPVLLAGLERLSAGGSDAAPQVVLSGTIG